MRDFVVPASGLPRGGKPDPKVTARLTDALEQVWVENRIPPQAEKRMVPSSTPKEKHHDFVPSATPATSAAK
jgi:hypothetical protein